MSIAKKLAGGGGSFGALTQETRPAQDPVQARRDALDAAGRVRRSSLAPVSSIVFNPLNPRKTIVDETIAELAESLSRQQIVPITVVSRDAFLDAHPEQAEAIGQADFIALDGNRRLLAAQRAGLANLRVDLNDDLVATAADMVEAALVANAHREGVPPFEEAQAIEQLLTTVYNGNQAAVARKLGKTGAWVSQRLALLHLTPELQEQADTGELSIEDARRIGAQARAGKLTTAGQVESAEAAKKAAAERAKAKTDARERRAAVVPAVADADAVSAGRLEGAGVNAVNAEVAPVLGVVSDAPGVNAVNVEGVSSGSDGGDAVAAPHLPEQRESAADADAALISLVIDPSDFIGAARAIAEALAPQQTVHLASALLAMVQREPEFQDAIAAVRGRNA